MDGGAQQRQQNDQQSMQPNRTEENRKSEDARGVATQKLNTPMPTSTAETDQDGFAYFDLLVDPILGGHTVTVEAHGNENGRRFGVAQTEFLRTSDFTAASVVFPNAGGSRDIYMAPRIIPGCVGDQPLIDVPTGNYEVSPSDHCYISASNSNFHTDGNGHARIHVVMDGNVTAAKECTVSWRGGSISVGHEY